MLLGVLPHVKWLLSIVVFRSITRNCVRKKYHSFSISLITHLLKQRICKFGWLGKSYLLSLRKQVCRLTSKKKKFNIIRWLFENLIQKLMPGNRYENDARPIRMLSNIRTRHLANIRLGLGGNGFNVQQELRRWGKEAARSIRQVNIWSRRQLNSTTVKITGGRRWCQCTKVGD